MAVVLCNRLSPRPEPRPLSSSKQGAGWALDHCVAGACTGVFLAGGRSSRSSHGAPVAARHRRVSSAARKWPGDSADDDAGGDAWLEQEQGKGGKGRRQRGSGKGPRVQDRPRDGDEFTEDIGGGAAAAPSALTARVQAEHHGQAADEEEQWHVKHGAGHQELRGAGRAASEGREAQWEEGEAEEAEGRTWGGGRQGKRTWAGPRAGLSTSQVEQRSAVSGDIKDAADWHELGYFVRRQGEHMDAEQAVQVLTKLSRCPQRNPKAGGRIWRQPDSTLQAMEEAFARPADEEAAQHYDQLLSILLGWILVLIPSFRPRQVSRCLAAMDHMQLCNLEVMTALKDVIVKHLINFELPDYGLITSAFSKLGYNPGPEFVEVFTKKTARKLQLMSADELGKVAFGLSAMGYLPCPEWSEAFWKASFEKAPEFSKRVTATRELLKAVADFAQAGQQPSQEWVDAVFGVLPMPARPNEPPRIALISMLLYTLSNLDCRPSPAWFNVILEAWRRQLSRCTPSDLGTISLYVGRYLGLTVTQRVGSQLLRATLGSADKMGAEEIAAVACLLGASQLRGSERDVDELVQLLKQRLHECSSETREMLRSAVPGLEASSESQELMELLEEAVQRDKQELVPELVAHAV